MFSSSMMASGRFLLAGVLGCLVSRASSPVYECLLQVVAGVLPRHTFPQTRRRSSSWLRATSCLAWYWSTGEHRHCRSQGETLLVWQKHCVAAS